MKDDDFKLLGGFDYGQTDERTDICDCRVTFATENELPGLVYWWISPTQKNTHRTYYFYMIELHFCFLL